METNALVIKWSMVKRRTSIIIKKIINAITLMQME